MKKFIYVLPFMLMAINGFSQTNDVSRIVGGQSTSHNGGGSSIGGGGVYSSLIAWCDDSTIVLDMAMAEAMERFGYSNDKIGAIKSMYQGLISAIQDVPDQEINFNSSITYKAISRGIGLAQVLGVPQIINGNLINVSSSKNLNEILSFFNFYYSFIQSTAQNLDKKFYAPYYARSICRDCTGIPSVQTIQLEEEFINYTISQITEWRNHFIKSMSNGQGYYPVIAVPSALKGLAYLSSETAKDLNSSLFGQVYACQSKRLQNLANQIQYYISGRGENSALDGIKLNQFTLSMDVIIKNISQKNCY